MTRAEIIAAVMALPPAERMLVVDEIVEAVDADDAPEGGTVKADPKLLACVREREDAVRRGEPTFSAAEVFAELRAIPERLSNDHTYILRLYLQIPRSLRSNTPFPKSPHSPKQAQGPSGS